MRRETSLDSNVEPLLASDPDTYREQHLKSSKGSKWLKLMILLQFGAITGLILTVASLSARLARLDGVDAGKTLYSPAQDAIEMQIVKSGGPSIYQGPPSDEVDEAWESLYRYGVSAIPKDQAALLPNKTYPLSFNTSEYIVQLEVFHYLHCLNQIRKAVHRDYYGPRTITEGANRRLEEPHLQHCFETLRESVMCTSDITPAVWQWNATVKRAVRRSDIVHSCRNFDKIADWARERHFHDVPDMSQKIEDDIVIADF